MKDFEGIEVHPAAAVFPLMSDEQLRVLAEDIRKHGQRESCVFYQGMLLDGRNRWRACKLIEVEPDDCEIDGEDFDPTAFVISQNLHRRQLKTSQKAMCAARMATLPNHRPKNSVNLRSYTAEQAAELFVVSTKAIEHARKVLREGCTELIALCDSGKSVATACRFIDECENKKEQSAIAKQGWKAVQDHIPKATPKASDTPQRTSAGESLGLPEKAPEETVAEVEAWLETQDERPYFERFKTLWDAADDTGRAAIRAFVLGDD